MTEAAIFAERAVAHFLDFSRPRDVVINKIKPYSRLDQIPSFELLIPIQGEGDLTALRALVSLIVSGPMQRVMLPVDGWIAPCAVAAASYSNDECRLEVRLMGKPVPQ